jgi:hypothetical protein
MPSQGMIQMRDDVFRLLDCRRLPGRLNSEEVAGVLNFSIHDIPVLVKAKLLKPLGNPPPQAVKYFASTAIEMCAKDSGWLTRATQAIYIFWGRQNAKRRSRISTLIAA